MVPHSQVSNISFSITSDNLHFVKIVHGVTFEVSLARHMNANYELITPLKDMPFPVHVSSSLCMTRFSEHFEHPVVWVWSLFGRWINARLCDSSASRTGCDQHPSLTGSSTWTRRYGILDIESHIVLCARDSLT
jgi:hypothetical protein